MKNSVASLESARRILSDLVSIPSVNPMGQPHNHRAPVERGVVEYIEHFFSSYDVESVRQSYSETHENLWLRIPGKTEGPVTLLESHMDTVPANDWPEGAFTPCLKENHLFGRGSCDDKASLAAMILAVKNLLDQSITPRHPVLLLAAGDEEYAQSGIKHFVACDLPIGRAVIGEPTNLRPVVQHKGIVRWDMTVHGRSAHSACPELGYNAILGMLEVINAIREYQEYIQNEFVNSLSLLTSPTITVTTIAGGRTRNSIPDQCTISVDFRIVPGMEPETERTKLIQAIDALSLNVTHGPICSMAGPLNTDAAAPFSQTVLEICRGSTRNDICFEGAPYTTDASWLPEEVPAIVLGPGSISCAHTVDENVDLHEVVQCVNIYQQIMLSEFGDR